MENGAQWLRLAEAAPQLGLSLDGLRTRVRRGQISSRRGNDGRLLVSVVGTGHELAERGQHEPEQAHEYGHEPAHEPAHELMAARERGARAEGEVAGLREALAVAGSECAHLRAQVAALQAELRKPWLVRLVEAIRKR
jgi:DNA-binding FrmR family transcriptional regulator